MGRYLYGMVPALLVDLFPITFLITSSTNPDFIFNQDQNDGTHQLAYKIIYKQMDDQQNKEEPKEEKKEEEPKLEEKKEEEPKLEEKGEKSRESSLEKPKEQGERSEEQEERRENKMQQSKVSQVKTLAKEDLWKPYDFLFPGGKLAKLIKVNNIYKKNLPIRDMLDKFKYNQSLPVINIIGAIENGRGKFYAGIARAAFNTDAVIVDNGLASGLQKFTLRRGVKLVGIAPQAEIKFPRINPSSVEPMELANGHTHLFLANNPDKDLRWGGETAFKIDLCVAIAEGKKKSKSIPRCKIVSILIADAPFSIVDEVKLCVDNEIPIIVVPGSPICDDLIKSEGGKGELGNLVQKGHFFYCNSTNSEDIAQLTHLLLSIRPW